MLFMLWDLRFFEVNKEFVLMIYMSDVVKSFCSLSIDCDFEISFSILFRFLEILYSFGNI